MSVMPAVAPIISGGAFTGVADVIVINVLLIGVPDVRTIIDGVRDVVAI